MEELMNWLIEELMNWLMPNIIYFHEIRNVRKKEINGFGFVAVSLHAWMPRIISDLNYYV